MNKRNKGFLIKRLVIISLLLVFGAACNQNSGQENFTDGQSIGGSAELAEGTFETPVSNPVAQPDFKAKLKRYFSALGVTQEWFRARAVPTGFLPVYAQGIDSPEDYQKFIQFVRATDVDFTVALHKMNKKLKSVLDFQVYRPNLVLSPQDRIQILEQYQVRLIDLGFAIRNARRILDFDAALLGIRWKPLNNRLCGSFDCDPFLQNGIQEMSRFAGEDDGGQQVLSENTKILTGLLSVALLGQLENPASFVDFYQSGSNMGLWPMRSPLNIVVRISLSETGSLTPPPGWDPAGTSNELDTPMEGLSDGYGIHPEPEPEPLSDGFGEVLIPTEESESSGLEVPPGIDAPSVDYVDTIDPAQRVQVGVDDPQEELVDTIDFN